MPRTARKISKTGFYHVIIRGVNKETIFIEDKDRYMFLRLLKHYKTKLKCNIYAYCLMSNHVHLLIEDNNLKLGELMKNITCVYAGEFNKKYKRVGHLFQDRFKSYNVTDDNYLLCLIRYIHRNPEKAGICKTEEYKWSSYNEIIYGAKIISRDFVLRAYSDNKLNSVKIFKKEMTEKCDDLLDSAYINDKLTDMEARRLIEHLINTNQITEISTKNIVQVVESIKKIKDISIEQVLRILGVSRKTYYLDKRKR